GVLRGRHGGGAGAPARRRAGDRLRPTQRGAERVSSMTCWNVGRFWNGKGGTETPLAITERSWSKQLACGLPVHGPVLPYSAWRVTPRASVRVARSAARQEASEPLPQ